MLLIAVKKAKKKKTKIEWNLFGILERQHDPEFTFMHFFFLVVLDCCHISQTVGIACNFMSF